MGLGTGLARVMHAMEAVMVHADRQCLVCTAMSGLLQKVRTIKMELGVKYSF